MKRKILCIDGGGIRGIIPGEILSYVEEQLQIRTINPDARLSDFFDMIAGTSTGGILTCCYLFPDKKFSARQAVNLYLTRGPEIFSIPLLHKFTSAAGITSAKYPAKNIEKILKEYFGDTKLSQLVKPCAITALDMSNPKVKIFNQENAIKTPVSDFYVRDVARATSAAPSYFPSAYIRSMYGNTLNCEDGGLYANNPSMVAFAEARTMWPNDDLMIISIGTGKEAKSYGDKTLNWGKLKAADIFNAMMFSSSAAVTYAMGKIETDFIRLDPSLGFASHDMDNVTTDNLNALQDAGRSFVAENEYFLNSLIDNLL